MYNLDSRYMVTRSVNLRGLELNQIHFSFLIRGPTILLILSFIRVFKVRSFLTYFRNFSYRCYTKKDKSGKRNVLRRKTWKNRDKGTREVG